MGFSVKQKRFIACFSGDFAAAAREAGITVAYAYRLLRDPNVQSEILAQNNELFAECLDTIAGKQERLEFWSSVMRGDVEDIHIDSAGKSTAVPASLKARMHAAELLGKAFCDFADRRVIEGNPDRPVSITLTAEIEERIAELIDSECDFLQ